MRYKHRVARTHVHRDVRTLLQGFNEVSYLSLSSLKLEAQAAFGHKIGKCVLCLSLCVSR